MKLVRSFKASKLENHTDGDRFNSLTKAMCSMEQQSMPCGDWFGSFCKVFAGKGGACMACWVFCVCTFIVFLSIF